MADDRMKQDDQQRNMAGDQDKGFGKQAPGRGGQQGGQQPGQQGQKGSQGMEDDDESATGGQGQGKTGGQDRGGQKR